MTGTTITPLNLEEMPPSFEPCLIVDGRCTTWCHKFRVDHIHAARLSDGDTDRTVSGTHIGKVERTAPALRQQPGARPAPLHATKGGE